MPRTAEIPDDPTEGAKVHATVNGLDEAALKAFATEIEDEMSKISTIRKNAKSACQPHLDKIKELKKDAAEAGIAKKAFSAKLRERSLLRRAEGVTDSLTEAGKAAFAEISAKLPLFQHLDG